MIKEKVNPIKHMVMNSEWLARITNYFIPQQKNCRKTASKNLWTFSDVFKVLLAHKVALILQGCLDHLSNLKQIKDQ